MNVEKALFKDKQCLVCHFTHKALDVLIQLNVDISNRLITYNEEAREAKKR